MAGQGETQPLKNRSGALFALICSLGSSPCVASDTTSEPGFYIGLFGGAGTASSMSARQEGGFYLPGPLSTRVGVDAQGKTGGEPVGVLGLQAGYEGMRQTFGPSEWALKLAAELEGLYIGQQSPVGDMPITPSVLGTQYVTLPMTVGVVLANAVPTVQTPRSSRIFPYLGVGAGVARLSIQGANSTNPSEPGINHFDSWPGCVGDGLRDAVQGGRERGGGQEPAPVRRIQAPHHQSHAVHLRRNASPSLADGLLDGEPGAPVLQSVHRRPAVRVLRGITAILLVTPFWAGEFIRISLGWL